MTIRLPKLLAKTVLRRDENCSMERSSAKPKIVLPKKIGFIFSKRLWRKNLQEKNALKDDNNNRVGPRKPTLSISNSIKGMLERFSGEKSSERWSGAGKQALNKSFAFNLTKMKGKMRNKGDTDRLECKKASVNSVAGKQGRSKKAAARAPGYTKMMKSSKFTLQKKVMSQQGEETEHRHEKVGGKMELCKKRILMGGKCRPLNKSGVLHYDENGILLPEDILSFED